MWGWGQWLGGCRTCGSPTLGGWTLQYQLSISLKCSCLGIVWPAKCGMAVARWRDGHSFKCWELKVLIFCFCTKSCVFFLENRIAYLGPALSLFFFSPIDVYMWARSFARHPCRQHHLRQARLWPWGQWPPGTRCCPGVG